MIMKAAASLTGSLLARKGAAYPASYSAPSGGGGSSGSGSTPYNSADVVRSGMPAAKPAVDQGPQMQDGRFVDDVKPEAPVAPKPASPCAPSDAPRETEGVPELPQAMDKMGRVRLSVRLDPDRYLRVKMASARTRWSAQDIVIAALDRYLGGDAGKKTVSGKNGEDDGQDDGDTT